MKHSATRELFTYWNALRNGRAAPERSEVDPIAIRDILADTFMLEVDQDRRFPFRLAGTRVNALFDDEQKGRSFLSIWRREERRNIAAILLTVTDGACPVVAGGIAKPNGQDPCVPEVLLLPLRHHGRTHARILGVVTLPTQPVWLGMLPIGPISLRGLRVIDAAECEAYPARVAVGQSAPEEPAVFTERRQRPRPNLRVITGGRAEF